MTIKSYIKKLVCFGMMLTLVFMNQCDSAKSNSPTVAKIGDRVITANEFAEAYEFSSRQITSKEKSEARQAVLDRMIDRILLAEKAEEMNLAATDTVMQRAIDLYRRQAINRELYQKYVRKPVLINEDEERNAFLRSQMTLYVKHYISDSENDIQTILQGKKPFRHSPLYPGVNTIETEVYGPVDLISWNDTPSEIEELLYNLPVGEYSKPFLENQKYHLFQVVDYEKQVIVRDSEFQINRESIHGILRKRKETKLAQQFIQSVMKSENLVIKASALNSLTEAIWQNRPTNDKQQMKYIPDEEIKFLTLDKQVLAGQSIAVFESGTMTVADILFNYKVKPQPVRYDSEQALRESLKNAVAFYVREWVFSEKGICEKLDKKSSVIEAERSRREYLLARKIVNKVYRECDGRFKDDGEFGNFLTQYIADLKEQTDIQIFNEQLMAVNTTDEGLARKIDFIAVPTQ
ncbi:MAG: SurA N-terminal domain-containing protein [Candidatus Marinimicrobia bacterium]|nr:SurA N-terminal domain-containing protein [Candidatus Neomarinimicrobiota bacterium]